MEKNLTPDEFDCLFTSFEKSAFRLETLPEYSVGYEALGYKLFLEGEVNLPDEHREWCKTVQQNISEGKTMTRVHLLPAKLTPYLKFEIERWYQFTSQAGEEIRLLLHKDTTPDTKRMLNEDFWLFDDKNVVIVHYGDQGTYEGATFNDDPKAALKYVRLRDIALEKSVSLKEFLSMYRYGSVS